MCVTARWLATVCRTVAVAAPASEEDASAVIATHGRDAGAARAISTTSRNSPDEETARTASPSRQRNPPRTATPHGTATIGGPSASASSEASQSACAT